MSISELLAFIKQIRTNSKGVTAMEYGVIAAAVIVAIASTMLTVGNKLKNTFSSVNSAMPN